MLDNVNSYIIKARKDLDWENKSPNGGIIVNIWGIDMDDSGKKLKVLARFFNKHVRKIEEDSEDKFFLNIIFILKVLKIKLLG